MAVIARGQVSWIQKVDADGHITINARPLFVGKRQTGQYVQPTLFTHRQRIVVYATGRRRVKTFRISDRRRDRRAALAATVDLGKLPELWTPSPRPQAPWKTQSVRFPQLPQAFLLSDVLKAIT